MDKAAVGYQEEGVIKLLQDIRDGLRGGVNRPNNDDNSDDNNDDNIEDEKKYADISDLETEEEAAKRTEDFYEQKKDNCEDIIKNLKDKILDL